MVYSANGAKFVLFFLHFKRFEFFVVDIGKTKSTAFHFGYANVAIFLFFGVDIIQIASGAFFVFNHNAVSVKVDFLSALVRVCFVVTLY